jgi:CelD/BcsL family acetyltransferase involved in cellulose biosynthesis
MYLQAELLDEAIAEQAASRQRAKRARRAHRYSVEVLDREVIRRTNNGTPQPDVRERHAQLATNATAQLQADANEDL